MEYGSDVTLTYIPGIGDDNVVEIDNLAAGIPQPSIARGSWREAMQDLDFVRDQTDLLELAAQADSETVGQ